MKRLLDIVVAVAGLLLLLPFLVLVALFVKIDSTGPVFFRQGRIGLNGRSFRIFKSAPWSTGRTRWDRASRPSATRG
jgi:lipopolysaccharide/colanic/teichoic acid biosynthesis glycosyltransferase